MDTMSECFNHQVDTSRMVLQHKGVDPDSLEGQERVDWTEYTLFAIVKEAKEVSDSYHWKRHRPANGPEDPEEVVRDLVDMQKYLWNAFSFWGVDTPEKFIEVFRDKSAVVMERWAQEREAVDGAGV